jgi:hypothetical protein
MTDRDERIKLEGVDPEDALRALMQVDPEAEPVEPEPCPKKWQGKPCRLEKGHHGPCQLTV